MIYVLKSNLGKTTVVNPAQKDSQSGIENNSKIPIYPKARLTKYIAATDEVNL